MDAEANRSEPRLKPGERLRHRLFHLLFLLTRPMTLGVRAIVHDREAGSVLLVRHTYVSGWQLPGGGIEPGETAEAALAREVEEEGNVVVNGRPILAGFHYNRHASRRDHVAVYVVTDFTLRGPKAADREIAEAGFFRLDSLPTETTPATRRRLAEYAGAADRSAHW
jgi:ADP-ribose pyrophosphatase YjhB (NUDIX family)